MKKFLINWLLAALLCLLCFTGLSLFGQIGIAVNGGFETGDYTGWQQLPSAPGQETAGVFNPTEGNFVANVDNFTSASASGIKNANIGIGVVNLGDQIIIPFDFRGTAAEGGFDQPNLACLGNINLTLNDECQALIIPRMVLTGNTGLIDAFPFSIVVQDSDPSNGPIVDGCGAFTYFISAPADIDPTIGFTGAFEAGNWSVYNGDLAGAALTGDDFSESDFTQSTLTLSTIAGNDDGGRFLANAVYSFPEAGTVSFDYDFNGLDPGFDVGIIVYTFEGVEVERIISDAAAVSGSASIEVGPGNSLIFAVNEDGFSPSSTDMSSSILTITSFSFTPPVNPLDLDFETCWGIVNAEDKAPPAVVTTPDDIDLLCVDLDDNTIYTLSASVSHCYRVNAQTGTIISGTMAAVLRARLLARTASPLVPLFTDGCSQELEVCVSDVAVFGADPSCDNVVITRTFVAGEVSACATAAGEGNPPVSTSYTITFDRPTLDDLGEDSVDTVVEVESCGADASVRPAPSAGDDPFLLIGDRTFNLQTGETICSIGVTYSDGLSIVTCPNTFKFVRTYTVIDWCAPGNIRTFTQVVKVGDTTAPTFTGPNVATDANGTLVYGTNAGNICVAYIRLDDVSATDSCPGTVSISAQVFPNGNLAGAPIGTFAVVPGGSVELSSAIPAGTHILRYTYSDVCGNTGTTDYDFRVEDQTPPVAICEDGLNLSIAGSANNGFAILTPDNIDAGSYDDCSGITRSIARVDANDAAIGSYGPQIMLTCADLGTVRVGLRVTDAVGNVNFCWLDVLLEDKLTPGCIAPEITFTAPAECFAGGEGCYTTVTLEFAATDECSNAAASIELDGNFNGGFVADNLAALGVSVNVANDGDGNYTVTATNVPVGAHAIRVRVSDGCGNTDVQVIEFCVTADPTPTPICIQTLTVTLVNDGNGGGIAAIWASDFIASPIEDCSGNVVDKYSLYRSSDAGAAGFTSVAGVLGIDDIDCDDFDNGTVSVRVYAFDDNGTTPDYCEVVVEVQDNVGHCEGSTGNLSGSIATQNDEIVEGVWVSLTSSAGMDETTMTSVNGTYSFTGLLLNADYTVQPVFDAGFNAQNVRASDLVTGIGQILGTAPFASAYQFVAADVNQDGSFDVFDLLAAQRAILGLDDGFAGGNWFMVEAGSEISMNNPYAVAFPEVFNANDLQGSVTSDFVAVEKMNLTGATGRAVQLLNVDDAPLESGQI
jgi:hypothetical protein